MSLLDSDLTERSKAIDSAAGQAQTMEGAGKRRGRPPGTKNKPKEDERARDRERLAGILLALFSILGMVAAWFGYVYDPKLSTEEAKDGAIHFEPIAERFPRLLSILGWIGAPIWLLTKIGEKFHKKQPERKENNSNAQTRNDAGDGRPDIGGGNQQPGIVPVQPESGNGETLRSIG